MTYTLVVKFRAAPGEEEAMEYWLTQHTAATQREEGCIDFLLHRDKADPRAFFIYESYVDRAAHTAHTQTEHFKTYAESEIQPRADLFELTELELL